MATFVKIKGLDRGKSVVADGSTNSGSIRGFRVPSALGNSVTGGTSVKGSKTIGAGNAAVTATAKIGGVNGNKIQYGHVVSGTSTPFSIVVTYTAATGAPIITVNAATDGGGLSTTTATVAAAAVNADPVASQYVTATAGGTGASVITAGAAAVLTSGANGTGTAEPFYQVVNNKGIAVVDIDDPKTSRELLRNKNRWVSLGVA